MDKEKATWAKKEKALTEKRYSPTENNKFFPYYTQTKPHTTRDCKKGIGGWVWALGASEAVTNPDR